MILGEGEAKGWRKWVGGRELTKRKGGGVRNLEYGGRLLGRGERGAPWEKERKLLHWWKLRCGTRSTGTMNDSCMILPINVPVFFYMELILNGFGRLKTFKYMLYIKNRYIGNFMYKSLLAAVLCVTYRRPWAAGSPACGPAGPGVTWTSARSQLMQQTRWQWSGSLSSLIG